MEMTQSGKLARATCLLRSPWVILAGIGAGVVLGVASPGLSLRVAPLGNLYLTFLTMCVIPIMVTAVVSSFGRLLSSHAAAHYLKRIGLVFVCFIMAAAAVGLAAGLLGKPGAGLDQATRATIGAVLLQAEQEAAAAPAMEPPATDLVGFMEMVIPANIFGALSEGRNLQILFFSLVFGFAVGLVPSASRGQFLDLTEMVFKVFEKVIGLAMFFLPFALFSMIAGQVAGAGLAILFAMGRFVVVVHAAVLVLLLAGGLMIAWAGRKSFFTSFLDLREPLVVAFGTRNSYAAMPSMLDALRENFRLPPEITNLVVPLSVVICRYSMILMFTIGAVFVVQLYNIPLSASQLGIVFGGAVLGMLAGAGAPGVIALSMISMVLIPLGLPIDATVILLLAVNFLIDPALTILNVYLTCVATVVIGRRSGGGGPAPSLAGSGLGMPERGEHICN